MRTREVFMDDLNKARDTVSSIQGKINIELIAQTELLLDIRDLLQNPIRAIDGCPPHDMKPYTFPGPHGGFVPPPTMRCTKCLMTA